MVPFMKHLHQRYNKSQKKHALQARADKQNMFCTAYCHTVLRIIWYIGFCRKTKEIQIPGHQLTTQNLLNDFRTQ